jgi:ArsR family transcriptional regulator, virulence genes transcriptional regulator
MNMQELTSRSEEVADLLKAMANGHRLLILCELNNGERSVSELEAVVPLSQSALSQHLAKLRERAIVSTRRDAQTIYYALADARVRRLMTTLHEQFCASGARPVRSKRK